MSQTAVTPLSFPPERPFAVGFVLCPGMLVTGTALPFEMWQAAVDYRRAHRQPGRALAAHLIATDMAATPNARAGLLALTPTTTLADCPPLDVVYLPALWRNPVGARRSTDTLGPWLRQRHAAGAHIAAVGSGVSLLAASGLLDGRAATTHWYYFERFAREFPAVDLKRRFFITQSGTLYCAASINSLADVSVHLIEQAFGGPAARHVERNFSHEIRRSYESYRYTDGGSAALDDEVVVEAQSWINAHLASRLTVTALARQLGVSSRTLDRRFRAALGTSPRMYWQRQRMQLAKELLEQSNLTIGEVAERVGYVDAGFFARLFQREMSVAPFDYRQTVRAKLFSAPADVNLMDTAATSGNQI